MVAWHGETGLKDAVMDRLREHRRLDEIVQGVYFDDGRGCHIGCITHARNDTHSVAERLFGIEQRVGYWLEAVFEGLPKKDCAAWVLNGTESIPVGADLSRCHHQFGAWILGESGLLTITEANRKAIEGVRLLHERATAGLVVSQKEWESARSAARSAAWTKIADKSIEIFQSAPILGAKIESSVKDELCFRRLWCPDQKKIAVVV